jgi:uncharacterized protein (TIGR04222 family)
VSSTALTLICAVVLAVTVVGGVSYRRAVVRSRRRDRGYEPTVYQLAAMVGGERRVAEVAACFLVWTGTFEPRENTKRVVLAAAPNPNTEFHPVEIAMINTAGLEGASAAAVMGAGRAAAEAVPGDVPALAIDADTRGRLAAIPGVVGSVVALVLGWWLLDASSAGNALGWAPVVFGVSLVVAGTAFVDPPFATEAGRRVIERRRTETEPDLQAAAAGVTNLPLVRGLTLVALYGKPAMTGNLIGLRNLI